MNEAVSHEESARALLRAGGRCHRCRARALEIVRWHPEGWWASFDFTSGCWRSPRGDRLAAHEIAGARDAHIRLRVVRVAATAPSLFADRVLVLCQACDEILNRPPAPPMPESLELPL